METLLAETRETASESINSKIHPFLSMEGQKAPRGDSLLGHNQAKCKRDNFILVIVFWGVKGEFLILEIYTLVFHLAGFIRPLIKS